MNYRVLIVDDEPLARAKARSLFSHAVDFRIVGEAGASRHSPAHGPGVSEHIVVTRGRMLAGPVGAEREAGAGDVLSWVSDSEHSYRVVEAPFEAILVILTPITP